MDERDPFEPTLERGPAPGPGGLFASLRLLLANLLDLAQTRVELLTTELSAEIQRAVGVLLWAFIALFFGGLAVLMLALTVIIAVWDEHRLLAAGVFSGLFLGVTLVAAMLVIPAVVARMLTESFGRMLLISTIVGAVCGLIGMYLSYYAGVPSGTMIVLVGAVVFLVVLAITGARGLRRSAGLDDHSPARTSVST